MPHHTSAREHWQQHYIENTEKQLSWFEREPVLSLELIKKLEFGPEASIIDIGGGASRLVDSLLHLGWKDISVLDISDAALQVAKGRLGRDAQAVTWIAEDVSTWKPERTFDLWHDRAAFHFLTTADDQAAYVARMTRALEPGGHAIIATFAPDGPETCSGLPIARYDAQALIETIGSGFSHVESRRHEHSTPGDAVQAFTFQVLRKN